MSKMIRVVGCGLLALSSVACGAESDGVTGWTEPVSDSQEAVTLIARDIFPNAGAVEVNTNSGKQTWVLGREQSGIYIYNFRNHSNNAWNGVSFLFGCCTVGRVIPTVWKQTAGEDKIVAFMMNTGGTITMSTFSPSNAVGSDVLEDVNSLAGLPAGYTLHSAALTGTGASKKVNLVVTNASNNLFTLDYNEFGTPGWGLHTVITSGGAQVNTRGYAPQISADGVVLSGRNTLSTGNESTVWRALKVGTHFQIDFTSTSPGAAGLPVPGRFISGQAGPLQNGVHYHGASNNLLMRQTTSLCTATGVTGSVATSSHMAAITRSAATNTLLLNGFVGSCLTSTVTTTNSAPIISDESKLTGWSQTTDGTTIFYKNTSNKLLACLITGTSTTCQGGLIDIGFQL